MKKSEKKLKFTKEMVRELTEPQLSEVAGGLTTRLSCGGTCESECFSCGLECG
ncbi:MAG TPA: class I lanthipeptide [Myxococcaceae bacterium]|nr:class I lanthipeptide [Myxococcaceae bacterium]